MYILSKTTTNNHLFPFPIHYRCQIVRYISIIYNWIRNYQGCGIYEAFRLAERSFEKTPVSLVGPNHDSEVKVPLSNYFYPPAPAPDMLLIWSRVRIWAVDQSCTQHLLMVVLGSRTP